jgi:uncharacterized protein
MHPNEPTEALAATRHWLERAVIGLNLCPFARPVLHAGRVRFVESAATSPEALLDDLRQAVSDLCAAPASETETTLLVAPRVLADFLDYNDFLDHADALLEDMGLDGVLQIASFHPQYQFAGTEPDDITNYTNRSPYPTLHLLREDSVARAVASHPDIDAIPEANIAKLRALGLAGWRQTCNH